MKNYIFLILLLSCALLTAQVALDPRYHTYEEMVEEIYALQDSFPDLVRVEIIGMTNGAVPYQDPQPIYAVKLSDNVTVDEDEPEILYLGPCHAEEVMGIEIDLFMLNEILTYRNVQPFSVWINNLEIWFVPSYNPEGVQVVMDDWDESYRKNKRDNNLNGAFDYEIGSGRDVDGADPNRNYGFNWIHGEKLYEGTNEEWNDYYRGPAPFSEGESRTIRDFAAQHHFMYSIAWHSSRSGNLSERVQFPFNWDGVKESPDFILNESIGETVAGLIETQTGSGTYMPCASQGRKGNAHDWFYKTHGTIQLLIECCTDEIQPPNIPPNYLVDDTCQRCRNGAYWLLRRALAYNTDGSMLTGLITDATTGDPLVARYIIEEREAGFFDPFYSDALYGRYWRPLSPGTYTLKVVKKGYEDFVLSAVVNNSQWTNRNVSLTPLSEVAVAVQVSSGSNLLDGTIIVDNGQYIEPDVIEFTNGSANFDHYEGEHQITVISDGYVPQVMNLTFPAGTYDLNVEMDSAVFIFTDDFENDLSNWAVDGNWALVDTSATGNYSVTDTPETFYTNNSTATLTLQAAVSLYGVDEDMVIEMWHRYHTEHDYDFCNLEYSHNGINWTTLASWSGYPGDWQRD
ncbi:MAG TPA: M14 family zinc carboxypeptidase, partial [Candidatus Cloacimonadota bacterium]|nr:M14 family zinc carboxypeptidase [Candidatus Cloacimonadota bacterium]